MKVAIVSTWPPDKCGIAEYSNNLLAALRLSLPSGDKIEAVHKNVVQVTPLELKKFDVVHFQNQGSFWSGEWFEKTLKYLKNWDTRTVVTFHDSAYWDGFKGFKYIDLAIAHRQDILDAMPITGHTSVMPMPIPEVAPRFCGYGLGRSDHEAIAEMCSRLGFVYEYQKPGEKWLEQSELIDWIKGFDGVILWYKDYGNLKGSSAGVRLAIAARRPVYLSKCDWFADVVAGDFDIYKAETIGELEDRLRDRYLWEDINKCFFRKAAELHYNLYKKLTEGSL